MSVTRLPLAHLTVGLGRLAVPVSCPGCSRADVPVCRTCAAPFAGPARDVRALAGSAAPWWRGARPPAVAVVTYEQAPASVVLAWKDHGRRDLTPLLGLALGSSVLGSLRAAHLAGTLPPRVAVVPVPSSRLGDARRGGNLVTAALRSGWPRIQVAAGRHRLTVTASGVLRRRRRVADQAGLTGTARGRNLAGALTVRGPVAADAVVLVDDVLTTGASLAEAARALAEAGAPPVVGAAVVAVTPRDRRHRSGTAGARK